MQQLVRLFGSLAAYAIARTKFRGKAMVLGIMVLFLQRRIVSGLTAGAVKG